MQLIYLVTDVGRRHAWNIVLHGLPSEMEPLEAARLRAKLATQKASSLLRSAYSDLPVGFASVLKRFGPNAQSADVYDMLHEIMSENPKLARDLSHVEDLTPDLVESLHAMPNDARGLRFVQSLGSKASVFEFATLLSYLQDMPDELAKVKRQIIMGTGVQAALHAIYRSLPFPTQFVPDSDKVRYIKNGNDMVEVAKRFKNCIAEQVPPAMRGEIQYYEWLEDTPAIVALRRYKDRWKIDEVKLAKNGLALFELRKKIHTHFEAHNVSKNPTMHELLEVYLLPIVYDNGLFDGANFDHMSIDLEYSLMID